ncbi:hypothetical protein NQ314_004683 [Rhamnusium bicolor]|uniref:Uncharacterized protein n=1 Tax=Rhamnusium bicolor TaxID=1586634 RepID=A0AAV8ZKH5_9CUCU|nr:hypothetical protein NQ314_004683 [Rhamnusium bicolor]
MKSDDPEQFFKYTRMTTMVFDYLLSKLKNKLKRRKISDQICPEEKLAITLQYADADDKSNGQWRMDTQPLRSVGRLSANTSSQSYQLRDILRHYFSTIGALPWKLQRIFQGQETIVIVE